MERAVGTRTSAAMEALANPARQYREARAYFKQFKEEVNLHADGIADYSARVEHLRGRWLGLLRSAVEVVLSMESYDASKGALSLRRTAGHVSETLTGQGGSAHKRSRKELGAGSMLQAALTSDPQPPGLPPGPPALLPLSRPTRCFAALGATWFPRRWAWGTPLCPAPLSATYHLLPSGHRQPPLAVGTGPVGPSPPVALLCLPV